jgi:hypothetical protein
LRFRARFAPSPHKAGLENYSLNDRPESRITLSFITALLLASGRRTQIDMTSNCELRPRAFEPGDASGKVANFPQVTACALMAKWFGPKTSVEPGNYTEKSNQVLAKCLSAPFLASELRGYLVVRRFIDLNRIDISANHACSGRLRSPEVDALKPGGIGSGLSVGINPGSVLDVSFIVTLLCILPCF